MERGTAEQGEGAFEDPRKHRAKTLYTSWMRNKEVQQRKLRQESLRLQRFNGKRQHRQPPEQVKSVQFQEQHDRLEKQYKALSAENQRFLKEYMSFHVRENKASRNETLGFATMRDSVGPEFNLFAPIAKGPRAQSFMTCPWVRRSPVLSLSKDIADKIQSYETRREADELKTSSVRGIEFELPGSNRKIATGLGLCMAQRPGLPTVPNGKYVQSIATSAQGTHGAKARRATIFRPPEILEPSGNVQQWSRFRTKRRTYVAVNAE